jgi:hypothetical protein
MIFIIELNTNTIPPKDLRLEPSLLSIRSLIEHFRPLPKTTFPNFYKHSGVGLEPCNYIRGFILLEYT